MTSGRGVLIQQPSVAESLRILLGDADCDGAMGAVEMVLSPGASGPPRYTCTPRMRRPSTCLAVSCPCRLAGRS